MDELLDVLRHAHGCEPGCPACASAGPFLRLLSLFERFHRMVAGPAGLRLAKAYVEHGIRFPPFSDDPVEQWLVEEALVTRLAALEAPKIAAEQEHAEMEAARQAARETLKETGGGW